MRIQRLADLLESPEVHQRLLGDYDGTYSISVTSIPGAEAEPAIRVRVEDAGQADIPAEIELDGEPVRVLVQSRFIPPRPLPLRIPI